MTLVIMAAGMGSRFGGLKQIEPIDEYGNFIIDYSIYDAIKEGFTKVVFIIKKENYDIFRDTVGKRVEKYIDVEYVFQEIDMLPKGYSVPEGRVKPWGTGHAILCCKDVVKENFAIINSDDFYGRDAFRVIAEFLRRNNGNKSTINDYAMAGYMVKNTLTENGAVKRGICKEENGYLTELIESNIESKDGLLVATPLEGGEEFKVSEDDTVSMNMFGFTASMLKELECRFPEFLEKGLKENPMKCEYFLPSVVSDLIEEDKADVKVLRSEDRWYGITYKEDKEAVVSAVQKLKDTGVYPQHLWEA